MVSGTVILVGIIGGISGGYVSSVLTNAYRDWRGNKVNVEQTQLTGHVRAEVCSGGVYQSHIDRMIHERDQLSQRIEKLQAFIDGDKFKQLDAEEQQRMENQLVAMNLYLHALAERLEAVGKTKQ